jgi:uncharacterized protein YihD (DUF1040 family)
MAKFAEIMNEIARLKNECIISTKQVSENDEKIHDNIDKTVDNLESSLDVCYYPNREVQIPLSKIYTEDIPHSNSDELMIKVVDRFNSFKSAFEESSQKLTDLIYAYRQKLKDLGEPVNSIKNETDRLYPKFKEAINILAQPLTIVVEGFEVEEFRKKNFKNEEVLAKFRQLLEELKAAFEKYNPALNSFNEVTNNLFDTVSQSGNSFSNFIEEKMLEKIKQIPGILNEGISAIPQTSKSINKFNEEIKKKEGDTQKEREDKYDEILIKVLNMTRKVDNQVFNSSKSIENDFKTLEEKVSNVKKDIEDKGNSYNEYVKILKDEGKKIIDIVNEIRKLFDKGPVSIKFDDKDIEFPFYEYAKRLNKGFEKIEEIKEEVQKPMKLVMVVLGDQINTVTLDLLFIMDITESMQDLLDETRDSIKYILDKIKRDSPGIDVRFAYEGYRDFADLKEGQKYYTIDFETDLDLFKSKLDEITAIGGGDDAEDVAGGLNAGLNMNWRSNARYAILIADAPGHGNQYHDAEVQDDYGNGDPNGLVLEELMEKYVDNNINLCLTKIDEYTDIMFDRMMQAYKARSEKSQDKPKIEVINYDEEDSNMIDDKNKNQKEKKRTMGNLVAKTAIEIYNHYSQKAEKSANQGAK